MTSSVFGNIFWHLPVWLVSWDFQVFYTFPSPLAAGLHKIKGHVEAIRRFTFKYVFNYLTKHQNICALICMCTVGTGIGCFTGDQDTLRHGSSQSVSVCLTINCCHLTVQSACDSAEQLAGRKGHYWECKQPVASAINGRGLEYESWDTSRKN